MCPSQLCHERVTPQEDERSSHPQGEPGAAIFALQQLGCDILPELLPLLQLLCLSGWASWGLVQVYSAEEKRALNIMKAEENKNREQKIMRDLHSQLQAQVCPAVPTSTHCCLRAQLLVTACACSACWPSILPLLLWLLLSVTWLVSSDKGLWGKLGGRAVYCAAIAIKKMLLLKYMNI